MDTRSKNADYVYRATIGTRYVWNTADVKWKTVPRNHHRSRRPRVSVLCPVDPLGSLEVGVKTRPSGEGGRRELLVSRTRVLRVGVAPDRRVPRGFARFPNGRPEFRSVHSQWKGAALSVQWK